MIVKIEGMACPMCEAAVKKALEQVPGVRSATASRKERNAVLDLDEEVSPKALEEAVRKAGFNFMGLA